MSVIVFYILTYCVSTTATSYHSVQPPLFSHLIEPVTTDNILSPFSDAAVTGLSWEAADSLNMLREELLEAGYTMRGVSTVLRSIFFPTNETALFKNYRRQVPALNSLDTLLYTPPHMLRDIYLNGDKEGCNKRINDLSSRLELLVQLFYLGEWVLTSKLEQLDNFLSKKSLKALNGLGLFFHHHVDEEPVVRMKIMLHPLAPAGSVLSPLLLATDHFWFGAPVGFDKKKFDPVMYLGIDSYGLVGAAPRPAKGAKILDTCTGSGVQGIAAAAYCAISGGGCDILLNDVNPRAIKFARFNLVTNLQALPGLNFPAKNIISVNARNVSGRTSIGVWLQESVWHGGISALTTAATLSIAVENKGDGEEWKQKAAAEREWKEAMALPLRFHEGFDLILANPPYLPDPQRSCELFGGGGDLGDAVLLEIVRAASSSLLKKDKSATLAMVGNVANLETVSARLKQAWFYKDSQQAIRVLHAHGLVLNVEEYAAIRNHEDAVHLGQTMETTAMMYQKSGMVDISLHSFVYLRHGEGKEDWKYDVLDLGGALWDRAAGGHGITMQNIARTSIFQHL